MISQWSDKLVLYREIVYNNVIPYNSVYQNLYAILNENLSNWITHRYQSTEIGQEEWLILAKQKHYAEKAMVNLHFIILIFIFESSSIYSKHFLPFVFLYYKALIYLFLESGEGREKEEGEKHQCVVAPLMPPTGDMAHNPSMCPDWDLNQQSFGLRASTQSTEPTS